MPKKGDKFVRRSPRQRGSTETRPFKVPRKVTNDSDVQELEKGNAADKDSQVELTTETENWREVQARKLAVPPLVNPYP
jgi:hypothetical protein